MIIPVAERGVKHILIRLLIAIVHIQVMHEQTSARRFAYFHTVPSLYLLYIFSWVITGIAECIYFRAAYKKSILKAQIW